MTDPVRDQTDETVDTADAVDDTVETGDTDPVAELEAERDRYFDQLQRTAADYANFRRRTEQERGVMVAMVRRDVLGQFLPVVDDLERALAHLPEAEGERAWLTGFTMIQAKFQALLERSGVEAIDPVGDPFDPSRHEAVATEPGTSGSTVVEVYQKGYRIGDVLVRPAMVKTGDPVNSNEQPAVTGAAPTHDA